MSYSFRHDGGMLPVTLRIDEREVERPCPTCARQESDGSVRFTAKVELDAGSTMARCSRGHLVMVSWTRERS